MRGSKHCKSSRKTLEFVTAHASPTTQERIPLKFVIPNGSIVRNLLFLLRDDKSVVFLDRQENL